MGYFVTSPIFGTLADRGPRRGLIAVGIGVWSLATIASGFADSLPTLIAARVFVGVGEASYATIAPTIIDDIAPVAKKGRWLALFYSAAPIGSALGYLVGGTVERHYGWSAAFYVAGGPGLVLAVMCMFIKEPARVVATARPSILASLATLARIPTYRKGVLGYAAYTFAVGGFGYWAPTFLVAEYGPDLSPDEGARLEVANFRFGILLVVGGAIGTAVGGWLCDRWARRALKIAGSTSDDALDRAFVHASLQVCALSAASGAPLALAAFFAPTSTVFFALSFFCIIGLFLSASPANAVVLRSVPVHQRAAAMALSIFAIHILGDLWSPPLIGALAGVVPRTMAMLLIPLAILLAAVIWIPRRIASPAPRPG